MNFLKQWTILGLLFSAPFVFSQEQYNPHSLNFNGYIRTGFGRSLAGGEMVQFQAPGTLTKPRFGNEANHYIELQLGYKYQPKDREDSYEIVYMMANYLPYSTENLVKSIQPETTQLYFKWNKIYKDADVWVGRRYYQRENVDMLDWFWLNSAQNADVGVGIENIKFKNNQNLNIAFLRFSEALQDPAFKEELMEDYKLDVRLKNIQLTENLNLNLLGQLGFQPKIDGHPYDTRTGYSAGAWTEFSKGNFYNRTSAIYRKGINMVNNPYSGKGLLEITADGTQVYNLNKAGDIQITSDFRYDDKVQNGFLGALTYQYKDFGIKTAQGNPKTMSHINATGRYTRYLSRIFNLTFDVGYDYVTHRDDAKGGLLKMTFSPEIKWSKGMFSRPAIRPFITYATWSEALKGSVGVFNGNNVYANKTSGFTAGLQLEIWW